MNRAVSSVEACSSCEPIRVSVDSSRLLSWADEESSCLVSWSVTDVTLPVIDSDVSSRRAKSCCGRLVEFRRDLAGSLRQKRKQVVAGAANFLDELAGDGNHLSVTLPPETLNVLGQRNARILHLAGDDVRRLLEMGRMVPLVVTSRSLTVEPVDCSWPTTPVQPRRVCLDARE